MFQTKRRTDEWKTETRNIYDDRAPPRGIIFRLVAKRAKTRCEHDRARQ